jgi:serine/threonine protein kinase/WD40 repeat protein/tetratricopeptide (TPR) repeat protein
MADNSERDPVEMLAEEFVQRHRHGERPALTEYVQRLPDRAEEIRELFPALVVMEQLKPAAGDPTSGLPHTSACHRRIPERIGDYRILREVGRGGMGIVYEAEQVSLGRHVALKILPAETDFNPTYLERFRREAKAAAKLHHTNIVPVFGIGAEEGVHFYAMQFIHGESLDRVLLDVRRLRDSAGSLAALANATTLPPDFSIAARGLVTGQFAGPLTPPESPPDAETVALGSNPLSTANDSKKMSSTLTGTGQAGWHYCREVARIGLQVADALAYAHRQGVLHRDIKPSNLLLDSRGTVWITDFGLAKGDGGDLTQQGDIVGTLRFMAPERFRGKSLPQSDIYSLGLTLYELLTLRRAFDDADHMDLVEQQLYQAPVPPRRLEPRIPRDLETIILKCLAKDPKDRYAASDDLAEDLRRFLGDRPIRARRSSVTERTWRWCRRNPAVASLSGAVAALLVVLGVGFVVTTLLRQERDKARSSQQRAEQAEGEARRLLRRAEDAEREVKIRGHLAQAQAYHWSGQVGQRFKSLDELAAAARLRPSLELRNEAIACLALTDLRRAESWNGFPSGTSALAFDARLEQYARSDERGNLSVRRVADDQELALLTGPGHHAYFLRFSPDGRLLAAIYDNHVPGLYVWDWRNRKTVLRSGLFGVADFSPDSRQLVLGEKGSIRLFNLISGQEVKRIPSRESYHAFAFDPRGVRLAVVCHATRGKVEIYDLDSGKVVITLSHAEHIENPSWSPDGHFLLATSADRCLYLWDVRTGKQQAVLRGHEFPPNAVAFSHNGNLLATTGWDGNLRLWEPMTGRLLVSVPGGGGNLRLGFSPDDRLLGCTTAGSEVELWEVGVGAGCRVLNVPLTDGEIRSTAFSRHGLFASASSVGVCVWDATSGREVERLLIGETRSVLFHPVDGSLFTSGSRGVYHWPVAAERDSPHEVRIGPPRHLAAAQDTWQIALSSDGHSLAVVDRGQGRALVVNPAGGTQVQLRPHSQIARTAISPDGRWVATSTYWGRQSTIKIWDALSGKLARDLPGEGLNGDAQVEFSPDGRWLVSGSPREYRFYEVGSWQPGRIHSRERTGSSASPLAFAPDSKILAILQNPRLVQLIEVATGQELARLTSPDPRPIVDLSISPDGSRLSAACGDGVIQVWDLRSLRLGLADLGLDWDLPPYPPLDRKKDATPLRVTVDFGDHPAAGLREAVEKQSKAIAENQNDAQAYFQRGRLYNRLQEFTKARDDFNRVIALEPDHSEAYHLRGHAHEGLGQAQKAIDDFSSALEGQPQNAHLFYARSRNYLLLKDHANAVDDLTRALELKLKDKPEQAEACNNLAWIYVAGPAPFRDPDKAQPLAQKAVELAPDRWEHCHTLGVVHYRLGKYEEAVEALERGIKNNNGQPNAFDLYFLAMCHHRLGNAGKAKECFDRAVAWQKQAKLPAEQVEELNAFRVEAEALLKEAKP